MNREERNWALLAAKGAAASMSEHAGSYLQVQTQAGVGDRRRQTVYKGNKRNRCVESSDSNPPTTSKRAQATILHRTSVPSLNNLGRLVHCCGFIVDKKWFSQTQLWIEREKYIFFVSWSTQRQHTPFDYHVSHSWELFHVHLLQLLIIWCFSWLHYMHTLGKHVHINL